MFISFDVLDDLPRSGSSILEAELRTLHVFPALPTFPNISAGQAHPWNPAIDRLMFGGVIQLPSCPPMMYIPSYFQYSE